MTLGSTQPITEMSSRNLPEGKWWPARKANNLTAIYETTVCLENVGASQLYGSTRHVTGRALPFMSICGCYSPSSARLHVKSPKQLVKFQLNFV
jgi:hypothetical protein